MRPFKQARSNPALPNEPLTNTALSNTRLLPGVTGGVADYFFAVWRDCGREFDGLAVFLLEVVGFGGDLPVRAAIEMFDDANFDRLFLVIAEADFESLR